MKNKLIVFGHLDDMDCYLNLSVEEAKKRHVEKRLTYSGFTLENIDTTYTIVEFDDHFKAYSVEDTNGNNGPWIKE